MDVNTGGAYDPVQSLFRVPVNGTYVIMASVSCQQAKTITDLMVVLYVRDVCVQGGRGQGNSFDYHWRVSLAGAAISIIFVTSGGGGGGGGPGGVDNENSDSS